MGEPAVLEPRAPATEAWRIDDLAHAAGVSVDTIRYYQREGLLPRPQRKGRHKLYGADHLVRLERIKELQERRFSLAAIRALLEVAGTIEGIFGGDTGATYSLDELTVRSGLDPALVQRLRDSGLLSDPPSCGRESYDGADLDVLHAVLEFVRAGIPEDVIVEITSIYVAGVEAIERQVLDVFEGRRDRQWDPDELAEFQARSAEASAELVPLVARMVTYLHQRTLQRLTLDVIDKTDPSAR